jgi:hypothetical protein
VCLSCRESTKYSQKILENLVSKEPKLCWSRPHRTGPVAHRTRSVRGPDLAVEQPGALKHQYDPARWSRDFIFKISGPSTVLVSWCTRPAGNNSLLAFNGYFIRGDMWRSTGAWTRSGVPQFRRHQS